VWETIYKDCLIWLLVEDNRSSKLNTHDTVGDLGTKVQMLILWLSQDRVVVIISQ